MTGLRSAMLVAAALLLGGCTTTFNITTSMPRDSAMPVSVRGPEPHVVVTNRGPGALRLEFDGDPPDEIRLAPDESGERTLTDRATFRIVTESEVGATFRIHAERARGLELGTQKPR